ncbi:hypothetical protein [Streptomyces sp. NPDC060366]|uniref:hypothetical protein n=1 Tax=Streptomyces sp. NPDC060366 TaxID=3347105 RepID=UPI00366683A9
MNSPDEFDRMMSKEFAPNSPEQSIDHTPYGAPAQPHKAGLTKRGKAALGIGATLLAGGTLVGYQNYAANVAESEAKKQELTVQSQALELEKIRELNRAQESTRQVTAGYDTARQASIDKCVAKHSDQIGKGFGSPSYRDIVDACQAQYEPTTSTDAGMEEAASAKPSDGDSSGMNEGALIGVGVVALFAAATVKRGTRSNAE